MSLLKMLGAKEKRLLSNGTFGFSCQDACEEVGGEEMYGVCYKFGNKFPVFGCDTTPDYNPPPDIIPPGEPAIPQPPTEGYNPRPPTEEENEDAKNPFVPPPTTLPVEPVDPPYEPPNNPGPVPGRPAATKKVNSNMLVGGLVLAAAAFYFAF